MSFPVLVIGCAVASIIGNNGGEDMTATICDLNNVLPTKRTYSDEKGKWECIFKGWNTMCCGTKEMTRVHKYNDYYKTKIVMCHKCWMTYDKNGFLKVVNWSL